MWGPLSLLIPGFIVFIIAATMRGAWGWLFALLIPLLLMRGFFVGLIDAFLVPRRHMDIVIEERGLGFLAAGERWWLFLDGIIGIHRYRKDTWTIQHHNGTVIHIAATVISDDQIAFLREAMRKGQTRQGFEAVVERGKQIMAMEEAEQYNKME